MIAIIWVTLSLIIGSVFYTVWSYLWKKFKEPDVKFSLSYVYSMLIAMLIIIIIVPFVLNNQAIPDTLFAFVIVSCGGLGFAANALFNTPLTYLLKKADTPVVVAADSATVRRIIEVAGVVLLIGCVLGASVYAAVSYSATITATGSITGVGVTFYSDASGQVSITSISWGNIAPGNSKTVSIYIKSTSNVPITLSINTMNWNPVEIAETLTFSWDYDGSIIQPGQLIQTDWTLTASDTAPPGTSFNFDIVVTATG